MDKYTKKPLRLALAAIIALIFFHYLGVLGLLEQGLMKIFLPAQKSFYRFGQSLGQISQLEAIIKENSKLQEEIAKLSIDYVKLASLEAENKYLRSELDYLNAHDYSYQMANIVSRLPFNDQVIMLDKGRTEGLVEGLAVTLNQGIIVGKVLKVEENQAYVALLTDAQSSLAVSFGSQSGTAGLVEGRAGLNLVMDYIPQNQDIAPNEAVVTSGLEELIPQGLLVGWVGEVNSQVGQIFKQAKIIPPFNYQNLQTVTVILKN